MLNKKKPDQQSAYIALLQQIAIDAVDSKDNSFFPIDPQGRVLLEIQLTEDQLARLSPEFTADELNALSLRKTTVSLDVELTKELKKRYFLQLEALLKAKLDKARVAEILASLEQQQKGSIIALQHEFYFHLSLTLRTYQKAIQALQGKDEELIKAHSDTMKSVNQLVNQAFAEALARAYNAQTKKLDINFLNHELDLARAAIATRAHEILLRNIKKQTKVIIDSSSLPDDLKHIAETTTATGNDLLYIKKSGMTTWIEGSEVAAHDRGIGKLTATRRIINRFCDSHGVLKATLHDRVQIRVPSLDGKQKGKTPEEHIEDVRIKLTGIANRYMSEIPLFLDPGPIPPVFIYNLHTSINHTTDDRFTKNKQTAGAEQILTAAHRYNLDALNHNPQKPGDIKPFCLVQNIPINNQGDELSYDSEDVLLEATLMSDMALLHTLYENSQLATQQQIKQLFQQYKDYLSTHKPDQPFFSQSTQGKSAIREIISIKRSITKVQVPPADTTSNIKQCLRNIVANNHHFDKNFSRLVQSLSVFLEPHSISGCKSANERAQSINGRVCVLDLLLLTPPAERTEEQKKLLDAITQCAHTGSQSNIENLRKCLAVAFNELLLQGGATLISLVDQGSGAKAQVRGKYLSKKNPNKFEEPELSYYHQSQTNIMQAHLGLTDFMRSACSSKVKEKGVDEINQQEQSTLLDQVGVYQGNPQQTVTKLLAPEIARDHLYDGIKKYQNEHHEAVLRYTQSHSSLRHLGFTDIKSSKFFRDLFVKYCASREFREYQAGTPDSRGSNPDKATVQFVDLFGKEGLELYQLALKEERFSTEYMNAVFDKAKKEYKGKIWAERPVVVVGGPSASGKTFAANKVVEQSIDFLEKQGDVEGSNYVVAADGADSREVSQMRKLAIRIANRQGFTGVKDLTKRSKVLGDVKDCILDAVLKTDTLGAVIPETFSKGYTIETLHHKISRAPKTKTIFSRVDGADPDEFRTVVGFMGSTRAWKTSGFDAAKVTPLDLNSTDDLAESKVYEAEGFSNGQKFSLYAQRLFAKFTKNLITFIVTNDMILLKPTNIPQAPKTQQWIHAKPNDEGTIKVSKSAYEAWLKSPDPASLTDFAKKFPSIIETKAQFKIRKWQVELEKLLLTEPNIELRPIIQDALSAIPKDLSSKTEIHQALLAIDNLDTDYPAIIKLRNNLAHRFTELETMSAIKDGTTLAKVNKTKEAAWSSTLREQQQKVRLLHQYQQEIQKLVSSAHAITQLKFDKLNRAFSILERRTAEKLAKNIHKLEQECSKLISEFEKQKQIINAMIENLPDEHAIEHRNQPYVASIKTQRNLLRSLLGKLQFSYDDLLLPTQALLKGNPKAPADTIEHDGLIGAIEDAKANRTSTQLSSVYELTYEDKPKVSSTPVPPSNTVSTVGKAAAKAQATLNATVVSQSTALHESDQRIYTVKTSGATVGKFSKEHFKSIADDANTERAPPVTQVVATDPPKANDSSEHKIMYAFAMAIELVANMETLPHAKNQLTLRGVDPEVVGFLFTALLLIGKLPGISFGAEALRVRTIHLNTKTQLGNWGGFKDSSYYNTVFKNNPVTTMIIDDLKTLLKTKEKHQQAQKALTRELTRITTFFNHNLQQGPNRQQTVDKLTKP